MPTSTLRAPSLARSRSKTVLWIFLGLTALFVFVTSEVFLIADYPMYHAYRLQVIADRHLLIPHVLAGIFALLIGPINFSSRIRHRHLKLHRILGRIYVVSVFVGATTGIALAWGRPGLPGTSMQAAAWIVCTTAAFITARNRQIASIANGWPVPMLLRLPSSQAACSTYGPVTGATSATASPPSASLPSPLSRCYSSTSASTGTNSPPAVTDSRLRHPPHFRRPTHRRPGRQCSTVTASRGTSAAASSRNQSSSRKARRNETGPSCRTNGCHLTTAANHPNI